MSSGAEVEDRDDVSMVLLQAGMGETRLDEPADVEAAAADDEDAPRIRYAESDRATFLVLEGRVTWLCGQALLDAALSVIESGRDLVIDLGRCDYLDSTVLGTLHELVGSADEQHAALSLQHVPESLLDAFRELSMTAVLKRISDEPVAIPQLTHRVRVPDHSRQAHRQRLLKAHEVLSELSEDNRDQFAAVLDALRQGLGDREPP